MLHIFDKNFNHYRCALAPFVLLFFVVEGHPGQDHEGRRAFYLVFKKKMKSVKSHDRGNRYDAAVARDTFYEDH